MDERNGGCKEISRHARVANGGLTQFLASCFLFVSLFPSCSSVSSFPDHVPSSPAGAKTRFSDLTILSGVWEYQEGALVYELMLDDHGNGSYKWHDGHFRTTKLIHHHWVGTWQQSGNDREGGFEAQLADDGLSAEGRWWYTRIGSDRDPQATEGHFSLLRKDP